MGKNTKRIQLSTQAFCGIVIGNGIAVALLCVLLIDPMMRERARELGTIGAGMEVYYVRAGLIGFGALLSTALALLSQAVILLSKPAVEIPGDNQELHQTE